MRRPALSVAMLLLLSIVPSAQAAASPVPRVAAPRLTLRVAAPSGTSRVAARTAARARAPGPRRLVPYGFSGVVADGPLLDPANPLDPEFTAMVQTGVESVRFAAYWSSVQPYPNLDSVPPAERGRFTLIQGIPTDFSYTDRIIQAAASHGLRILPIVFLAPGWARKDPNRSYSPPADPVAYGRFVGVLEARYGPHGSFWNTPGVPYDPVRDWQIWNEPAGGERPNGPSSNWDDPAPFQQRYVAMLRAARAQVKAADPQGRIILAGNFGFSWFATEAIYRAHARGLFDAVALNIFTRRVADTLDVVRHNRAAMDRHGDRRLPIMLTEVTWPSSQGHLMPSAQRDYEVTPAVQAQRVASVLRLMAAYRRVFGIERVFWNAWASADSGTDDAFTYAGLRTFTQATGYVAKPAQRAFALEALRLEGCSKLSSALRCGV